MYSITMPSPLIRLREIFIDNPITVRALTITVWAKAERQRRRQVAASKRIDCMLKEEGKALRRQAHLIVLGPDAVENAAVYKDMRIALGSDYSPKELLDYRPRIRQQLLECARAIACNLSETSSDAMLDEEQSCRLFQDRDPSRGAPLDPELAGAVQRMWPDSLSPTLRDFIPDVNAARYLIASAQRISAVDYIPTQRDILFARDKCSILTTVALNLGKMTLKLHQVPWCSWPAFKMLSAFSHMATLIFCAPLTSYDQIVRSETETRLQDSLHLFEMIVNSPWLSRTSVVLYLTRLAEFLERLSHSPLENIYPEYEGGPDVTRASLYIQDLFMELNRANLTVYPLFEGWGPSADAASHLAGFTLMALKESILKKALQDSEML